MDIRNSSGRIDRGKVNARIEEIVFRPWQPAVMQGELVKLADEVADGCYGDGYIDGQHSLQGC